MSHERKILLEANNELSKRSKIMPNILKNESWKDVADGSASVNFVAIIV